MKRPSGSWSAKQIVDYIWIAFSEESSDVNLDFRPKSLTSGDKLPAGDGAGLAPQGT